MKYEADVLPGDKHKSFLQVDRITSGVGSQAAKSAQNKKFAISLQNLMENLKNEVDFLPSDKHQTFLQINTLIPSFYVCVARHAQITQNSKFAMSLQYLKKEV